MTAAYTVEHRWRPSRGPLDYDDSLVPGQIVAAILRLPHVTDRKEHGLGLAARWGYGSIFGIWHGLLRRRYGEPIASIGCFATLMTATLSLFPLLGHTPPPWRWPREVIATALRTHVVYVAGLARRMTGSGLRRR